MPSALQAAVGIRNSVKEPDGVTRPMRLALLALSVNQRLPSGPVVIWSGRAGELGMRNSVITPSGVMRPMPGPKYSVNQTFPSGPAVIRNGPPAEGTVNSEIVWPTADAVPRRTTKKKGTSGSFIEPPY
jgi:hypothetical protein